jgi:hypothetical protein
MVIQGNVGVRSTGAPVTYTWDDDGAQIQPFIPIVPGTYQPHSGGPTVFFAPPAPSNPALAAPAGTARLRQIFLANTVGGLWRLWVTDDSAGDAGTIASFSMVFGHSGAAADYVATRGEVVFGPGITSRTVSVTIPSDTNPESNKTFVVNLLAPTIGVIGDGQGIGTIIDDDSGARGPTAVDDVYNFTWAELLGAVPPIGVLANDNSNDGGSMTAELVSPVSHGTLTLNANGGFTYRPELGFVGADTFTYRAVNANGNSNVATVTLNISARRPVQPPTGLRVDAVSGKVRLVFTPPTEGPPATGYELAGGLLPSQTLAVLPTGSTNPVFEFDAPGSGSYWIRMHTIAGGERSGPSNEVPLHVTTAVTPSAPINLLGLVNGSSLALVWRNTYGGGIPTNVILNVTGALSTSISLPTTEAFAFNGVPNGTYTFTVQGSNAGGLSPLSNPVTLSFPGTCTGPPQPPEDLHFYAELGRRQLRWSWNTPTTGPAPTGYVVNVTSPIFTGSVPVTERSISATVPPGSYTLSVAATNACGTSAPTAPVTVVVQ